MSLNWWWGDYIKHDGICARLASINTSYEPRLFAAAIAERAHMSHVSMAAGSVSIDDSACEIFEASFSAELDTAFAMIAAVSAGRSKGGRCCCSQDAILFIVQQWLILVLHGRMRYWNPVRVSMWAPMVKHGNFVLDLPDQNCARGLCHQHSLPLLPIWKLVRSRTIGLYESLCTRKRLAYE